MLLVNVPQGRKALLHTGAKNADGVPLPNNGVTFPVTLGGGFNVWGAPAGEVYLAATGPVGSVEQITITAPSGVTSQVQATIDPPLPTPDPNAIAAFDPFVDASIPI